MKKEIEKIIEESIEVKEKLKKNIDPIEKAAELIIDSLRKGGKILLCGNGGSAADAQHIAAEFVVKFKEKRKALPAISLSVDPSIVTAASNDLGYENVFKRQIEALGNPGDVLIAISTSGRSPNILKAVEEAKKRGMKVIYFCGENDPLGIEFIDIIIKVPSRVTARIQESHILIGHIITEIAESRLLDS